MAHVEYVEVDRLEVDIAALERAGWRQCNVQQVLGVLQHLLFDDENLVMRWIRAWWGGIIWAVYDDGMVKEVAGILHDEYSNVALCWNNWERERELELAKLGCRV